MSHPQPSQPSGTADVTSKPSKFLRMSHAPRLMNVSSQRWQNTSPLCGRSSHADTSHEPSVPQVSSVIGRPTQPLASHVHRESPVSGWKSSVKHMFCVTKVTHSSDLSRADTPTIYASMHGEMQRLRSAYAPYQLDSQCRRCQATAKTLSPPTIRQFSWVQDRPYIICPCVHSSGRSTRSAAMQLVY